MAQKDLALKAFEENESFNSRKPKGTTDVFKDIKVTITRGRLVKYANPGYQEEEKSSFEMEMLNKHANMD